ncbi:MAG: NADH-quinone oxidoreductase subunit L [Polyangiales bacterium]
MGWQIEASEALVWMVLSPLCSAVLLGILGKRAERPVVQGLAVGSVALSFVLAVIATMALRTRMLAQGEVGQAGTALVWEGYRWFSVTLGRDNVIDVHMRLVFDALAAVMTLVVSGIGLLIHVYSVRYMEDDPAYARFFAYLNLFIASMLLLVLASSLPLMFVGWEGVGLCSFLLIAFWWRKADYAAAGQKAFLFNRAGDLGVLLAMWVLLPIAGSFEFGDIQAASARFALPFSWGTVTLGTVGAVGALLLFFGCAAKSAQLPLALWLPDAMAGPTPVSALIHAATMVTAGVYLCARLAPLFVSSAMAQAVLCLIGALTALFGASVAAVQPSAKRVLAYSTISQLGFMFAAVGVGAMDVALFHVFTHAFFKAALFLGAGSVMHALHVHGDVALDQVPGRLGAHMPRTRLTFAVSAAALAGVPLTSGFFSKDLIFARLTQGAMQGEAAWVYGVALVALVLAAAGTAYYALRLYLSLFHAPTEAAEEDASAAGTAAPAATTAQDAASAAGTAAPAMPHGDGPWPLWGVLAALAAGAVLAGWVWGEALHLPVSLWPRWLAGVQLAAGVTESLHGAVALVPAGLGLGALVLGGSVAWRTRQGLPTAWTATGLHRLLRQAWDLDALYARLLYRPARLLATACGGVDRVLFDRVLLRGSAQAVRLGGVAVARLHTGAFPVYAAALVAGVALLSAHVLYPHARGQVLTESDDLRAAMRFEAERGFGYDYRWDFDGDGDFDTDWQPDGHTQTHVMGDAVPQQMAVLLNAQHWHKPQVLRIEPGKHVTLPMRALGLRWQRSDAEVLGVRPALSLGRRPGTVRLNPGSAAIRGAGGAPPPDKVLAVGAVFAVGQAQAQVVGLRQARLEVRNVFGHVAQAQIWVPFVPETAAAAHDHGAPAAALARLGQGAEVQR